MTGDPQKERQSPRRAATCRGMRASICKLHRSLGTFNEDAPTPLHG
jgi:hypothetical protein